MIINVYGKVLGSTNEIYEITHMFNEMHEIKQFVGLEEPRCDVETHHRQLQNTSDAKIKEFSYPRLTKLTHPWAVT